MCSIIMFLMLTFSSPKWSQLLYLLTDQKTSCHGELEITLRLNQKLKHFQCSEVIVVSLHGIQNFYVTGN